MQDKLMDRQVTYFAHLLIALDECVYDFNGEEVVVNRPLRVRVENIGRDNGSQVVRVHFRA